MIYPIKIMECPACRGRQNLKAEQNDASGSECYVCMGSGILVIPENAILCVACQGKGFHKSSQENIREVCRICRGFGILAF